jgi:hypothetical protein
MSGQDEQKYGLEGVEASQGYSPMPLADAPPQEDLAIDATVENFVSTRDDPAPIVERAFFDVQTGEPRPSNETVSAEDAARNVANVREAERQAVEKQHNRDLAEALDQLHGPERQPVAVDNGRTEPQPDYQPQPEAAQATDPNIDPAIAAALENPAVRGLLQRASQEIEQQKAAFIQATNAAAAEVTAAMLVSFPEFTHVKNAGELAAAATVLAQQNPQRFQQFRDFYNRTQTVLQQQQQVAAQTARHQQELASAEFQKFATYHDANSLLNETPESLKQIRTTVIDDARRAGISEADLVQAWNSIPALRHSFVQDLMADGVKFRLAQRNVAKAVHHPVPHVQRPGSSAERVTRTEEALAEARAKLKPSMSAKEAAAYLIARRAAR